MTNIIVLGGSGFIGKSLIDRLEKTNSRNTTVMVHPTKIKTSLKKFQGNILDKTLKKNIQDEENNMTRFLVMGKEIYQPEFKKEEMYRIRNCHHSIVMD